MTTNNNTLLSPFGSKIKITGFDKKDKLVTYIHLEDQNRKKTEYIYPMDWLIRANPERLNLLESEIQKLLSGKLSIEDQEDDLLNELVDTDNRQMTNDQKPWDEE